MSPLRIIIVGGGASGVFAALQCRKRTKTAQITIVEKSDRLLTKVRASGGGRCNLAHTAGDVKELLQNYPRGQHFLRIAFGRFGVRDTAEWFTSHNVALKKEADGRMFPASDRSQTVVDCFTKALEDSGISVLFGRGVQSVVKSAETGCFTCLLDDGSSLECDRFCYSAGGNWDGRDASFLTGLGHRIVPPIPSLFTLVVPDGRIAGLPGVSVADVIVAIPKTRFSEQGPLLITHRGLSGPALLRLSSRAARFFSECAYSTTVEINWCPSAPHQDILEHLKKLRANHARMLIAAQSPDFPPALPVRLWQSLAAAAGCGATLRWADMTKQSAHDLAGLLHKSVFSTAGMDTNKAEFVTCGGVALGGIDPFTMQSSSCDGLYFAGEVMDIDGITGGFNLQAAWTTGWIAGEEMGK